MAAISTTVKWQKLSYKFTLILALFLSWWLCSTIFTAYILFVCVWALIFHKCMHLLVCSSFCFPFSFNSIWLCVSFHHPPPCCVHVCVFLYPFLFFIFMRHISKCICAMHSGNFAAFFAPPHIQFIGLFHLNFFSIALNYQCRWSVRKVPKRLKYLWQMGNKLLHKMCLFICLYAMHSRCVQHTVHKFMIVYCGVHL